jgi:hypothetical protein
MLDMTKWTASEPPIKINFLLDGVDKSLLYRTIRETRAIVKGGIGARKKDTSAGTTIRKRFHCPKRRQWTVEQCLSLFFTQDNFLIPFFWRMVSGRTGVVQVCESDLGPFLKVQ